jgi:PAS domain-containing protein
VAIFDRDQRLQFHNQAFQRLWELDTPFLARRPDNGEFLERLRADGKLPEPHAWRDWKEQMLSVYRSVETTPHLWHLPDGQTLNVFANAHPQGGVTWVFENLTEKVDLETKYNTLAAGPGRNHRPSGRRRRRVRTRRPESACPTRPSVRVVGPDRRRGRSQAPTSAILPRLAHHPIANPMAGSFLPSEITGFDEERRAHDGRIELVTGLILDYAWCRCPTGRP